MWLGPGASDVIAAPVDSVSHGEQLVPVALHVHSCPFESPAHSCP